MGTVCTHFNLQKRVEVANRRRRRDKENPRQIPHLCEGRKRRPKQLPLQFTPSSIATINGTFRYSFIAFESLVRSQTHSSLAHSIWIALPALSSVFLPSAKLTWHPIQGNYLLIVSLESQLFSLQLIMNLSFTSFPITTFAPYKSNKMTLTSYTHVVITFSYYCFPRWLESWVFYFFFLYSCSFLLILLLPIIVTKVLFYFFIIIDQRIYLCKDFSPLSWRPTHKQIDVVSSMRYTLKVGQRRKVERPVVLQPTVACDRMFHPVLCSCICLFSTALTSVAGDRSTIGPTTESWMRSLLLLLPVYVYRFFSPSHNPSFRSLSFTLTLFFSFSFLPPSLFSFSLQSLSWLTVQLTELSCFIHPLTHALIIYTLYSNSFFSRCHKIILFLLLISSPITILPLLVTTLVFKTRQQQSILTVHSININLQ